MENKRNSRLLNFYLTKTIERVIIFNCSGKGADKELNFLGKKRSERIFFSLEYFCRFFVLEKI